MAPRCPLLITLLAVATAAGTAQTNPSFELSRDTNIANTNNVLNSVVTGDFNNDGKPDYIAGGGASSQDLVLRLGNGDGTFQAPKTIGSSEYAEITDMAVADVNGDGNLDLVVVSSNSTNPNTTSPTAGVFQVFLGNGDGTFQAPLTYTPTNAVPYSVTVADLNGDGHPDIAIGDNNTGKVEIWNNDGTGAFIFTKDVTVTPVTAPMEVRAGQFDGDGINHIAVGADGEGLNIAWNDGHENFTTQWVDTNPSGQNVYINVGQVAQDGRDDVIMAYECPYPATHAPPTCETAIDVMYGQGDEKTIVNTVVSNYEGIPCSIPWAVDVNGDGIADLVLMGQSNRPGGIYVWLGQPNGTFSQTALSYSATTDAPGSLAAADFNRDGMMDFVGAMTTDQEMEIFLNSGPRAACATSQISPSVTVCAPVNNTYSNSPVRVEASSFDTTAVTAMQEYVDGKLDYSEDVTSFNTTFAENSGQHLFVTKAWDAGGRDFVSDRTITVYSGTPGEVCPVAESAAAICLPSGATSSSPVQIVANGWTPNVPTAAQLYIDGNLVVNEQPCNIEGNVCEGTSYVSTTQSLSSGSHDLVFKLWDDLGNDYEATKTITVE